MKSKGVWHLVGLRVLPPTILFVALIASWQSGLFHDLLELETYTVPYPLSLVEAIAQNQDVFMEELGNTLIAAGIGYGIGSVLGVGLAILLSEVSFLRRYILPLASGFSAMPILATAPLMVLYFGLGYASAVAVVVLMSIPPTIISVFKGLISVDEDQRDLMDSVAAGRLEVLIKLKLPTALPYLFTSLKLNVTLALVGVIVTEFVTSQRGLGTVITRNLETFNMPMAWASMGVVALSGVAWFQAIQLIERLSIGWHASIRNDS